MKKGDKMGKDFKALSKCEAFGEYDSKIAECVLCNKKREEIAMACKRTKGGSGMKEEKVTKKVEEKKVDEKVTKKVAKKADEKVKKADKKVEEKVKKAEKKSDKKVKKAEKKSDKSRKMRVYELWKEKKQLDVEKVAEKLGLSKATIRGWIASWKNKVGYPKR